jgi:hypothetical protein
MGIKLIKKTKHEARMHLGRCKNCGSGWTKTSYLDELEPDVRKYFRAKGYPDNADICPKCVAAAKAYLAKNGTAASNSNEAFDGWDGWEEIEGLEDALDGIENLAYELRSCVRGAKTRCKDWKALARHIQDLASKLDDAAGEMKYRQDESKKENGGN